MVEWKWSGGLVGGGGMRTMLVPSYSFLRQKFMLVVIHGALSQHLPVLFPARRLELGMASKLLPARMTLSTQPNPRDGSNLPREGIWHRFSTHVAVKYMPLLEEFNLSINIVV